MGEPVNNHLSQQTTERSLLSPRYKRGSGSKGRQKEPVFFLISYMDINPKKQSDTFSPGTGREMTTALCNAGIRTLDALLRLSRWLLGFSPGLVRQQCSYLDCEALLYPFHSKHSSLGT